jgi:glutathione synthase/RimK-type ligase-like ATP-grasp enzyme
MGGNTPVEFLLEGSDVELLTLFIAPGLEIPNPLPAHDIAIVTICDSEETQPMLEAIEKLSRSWPCPILNMPSDIIHLDRDKICKLLVDIPGLEIPMTGRVTRSEFADAALSEIVLHDVIEDGAYPLIARPAGSHAGNGLAKIDSPSDVEGYLSGRTEDAFFISRYVDYAGADGQFHKYRIVFVDRKPHACHLAVCDDWKVWYLNANMSDSAAKRAEEERFMTGFDEDFAKRHGAALDAIAARIGLDYFAIDCAETKDGRLLVFEADNAAIVHNMDPVDLFPYKGPQMRKIFDAFIAMLYKCAGIK